MGTLSAETKSLGDNLFSTLLSLKFLFIIQEQLIMIKSFYKYL